MAAQQVTQKMVANLCPGERIRFHVNELQFKRNLQGWIEGTVEKILVSKEGWHLILTKEYGRLRRLLAEAKPSQLPETKHFVIS